jgi:hypothetical protein
MATTNDLLKDVCATFLAAYGQNPQAASENIIAFEEMGIIPGLTTGSPNSAAAAVEFASTLGRRICRISAAVSMCARHAAYLVNYDSMLEESAALLPDTVATTFSATKASARQRTYDNSSRRIGERTHCVRAGLPCRRTGMTLPSKRTGRTTPIAPAPPAATPPAAPPAGTSGSTPRPPLRIMTPMAPVAAYCRATTGRGHQ